MKAFNYSKSQLVVLVLLRLLIGWHFLYEGLVKLMTPSWSAGSFLLDSQGFATGLFEWMANTEQVLEVVSFLNIWGLIFVGLGLMFGLFARWASIGGMLLLFFYYLSHPPFIGVEYLMPSEGSYLVVNKNLIELAALSVLLLFPTSRVIGLDRLIYFKKASS
jgi:thiosulfate dehydrogenase (quinone) large subunit